MYILVYIKVYNVNDNDCYGISCFFSVRMLEKGKKRNKNWGGGVIFIYFFLLYLNLDLWVSWMKLYILCYKKLLDKIVILWCVEVWYNF